MICFYFTTLPLNKHQSRTTILLCSLVIVKSNYKMKVLFSPFGYITWKVNDNWIRNKKKCQNIPLGKKLDELIRAKTTKDVLNQFFIFCHVLYVNCNTFFPAEKPVTKRFSHFLFITYHCVGKRDYNSGKNVLIRNLPWYSEAPSLEGTMRDVCLLKSLLNFTLTK